MRVFYTGCVLYFGTTARGTKLKRHHPGMVQRGQQPILVEQGMFERCQEIRRQSSRPPRRTSLKPRAAFPLTGLLFCSECGSHLIGARLRGERRYLCNARIQHRLRCMQPSIRAESVEGAIVGLLSNLQWPDDWREEWRQVLESAGDPVPLLQMTRSNAWRKNGGIQRQKPFQCKPWLNRPRRSGRVIAPSRSSGSSIPSNR